MYHHSQFLLIKNLKTSGVVIIAAEIHCARQWWAFESKRMRSTAVDETNKMWIQKWLVLWVISMVIMMWSGCQWWNGMKKDEMITNTSSYCSLQVQFCLPDSRGSKALVFLPVWRPQRCREGFDQRTATLAVKKTGEEGDNSTADNSTINP